MIEELFSKLFFIKYEPMLRCIINCRKKIFKIKFLLYFLPKQFCTHHWFIKKLERREKFEIFGIQENMIATNLKKLINDNTIIKSGGCKIRLYILTNMRWVHFSQNSFKQFWLMHTSWEKIPVYIREVSISSLIWYKFDRGIFFQRY